MPKPIRTYLVDDEPLARRTLAMLLESDDEIEVVGQAEGVEALELLPLIKPDLLFLDVQMPEVDGFQLLAQLGPESAPAVVFVTAYDEHALRAFQVHAIDYLLKPFDDARFFATLRHVKQLLQHDSLAERAGRLVALLEESEAWPGPGAALRRFVVRTADRLLFVKPEEVDWIESADYYVRLHVGKSSHLVRRSMNDLERCLSPQRFLRIHRSVIVNLERVRELVPFAKGEYAVILVDGTKLRMTRGRWEELQRRLSL